MIEFIICVLLLIAASVVLLAAVGLVRMPDLPTRMHTTTKSGVFALVLIMIAVGLYFVRVDIVARVLSVIVFTLITAPIAAHAIGRAGYLSGISLWSGTIRDDLKEYYHGSDEAETSEEQEQNNQQVKSDQ